LPLKAAKAVDRLLDFYGALDVGDSDVFTAGLIALFAEYPDEVIALAIDPVRGIPGRLKVLRLASVREILDEINEPFRREIERKRRTEDARRGQVPPRSKRTPEEQARVDAQVERWRAEAGLLRRGFQR
jgi:hypothetical protein